MSSAVFLLISMFGLFQVKYYVENLTKELNQISKNVESTYNSIHTLEAEWSYLNNPMRLEKMGLKYLQMQPIQVSQVKKEIGQSHSVLANKSDN